VNGPVPEDQSLGRLLSASPRSIVNAFPLQVS
jgi:hypothetical protein